MHAMAIRHHIKVLVVDDDPSVCKTVTLILKEHGYHVDEFTSPSLALAAARRQAYDLALIDLKMPEMNGVLATQQIRAAHPEVRVLVLTTYDADEWLFDAIRNGADGYLLKDTSREQLILAIREVFEGKTPVDTKIAGKLFTRIAKSPMQESTTIGKNLSEREMQILRCLSRGMSNADISHELYLSEGTVRNYISSILEKLEVDDRTQAAVLALRYGLVD